MIAFQSNDFFFLGSVQKLYFRYLSKWSELSLQSSKATKNYSFWGNSFENKIFMSWIFTKYEEFQCLEFPFQYSFYIHMILYLIIQRFHKQVIVRNSSIITLKNCLVIALQIIENTIKCIFYVQIWIRYHLCQLIWMETSRQLIKIQFNEYIYIFIYWIGWPIITSFWLTSCERFRQCI